MTAVSVIIPAYNAKRHIAEAIDSALSQTHPPCEVIVVDDGSTDGTPELVERYGPPVRLLRQKNAGPGGARNRGIEEATGDWIAFLDADDIWEPTKTAQQLALAGPQVGLVYCDRLNFGELGGVSERQSDAVTLHTGNVLEQLLIEGNFLTTSSAIAPKHVLCGLGGFNEDLMLCEDWELWIRLACGWEVACCPETLVRYRRHGTSITKNSRAMHRAHTAALDSALLGANCEVSHEVKRLAYRQANDTAAFFARNSGDFAFAAGLYLSLIGQRPLQTAGYKGLVKCLLRRR